jgi:hypothetical protein
MKLLLNSRRGLDPASNNNLALRLATYCGHADILKLLLNDPRVDPLRNDNEFLISSRKWERITLIQHFLRDDRVDPAHGETIYGGTCIWLYLPLRNGINRVSGFGSVMVQHVKFSCETARHSASMET